MVRADSGCGNPVIVPVSCGNFSLNPKSGAVAPFVLMDAWATPAHGRGMTRFGLISILLLAPMAALAQPAPPAGTATWFGLHYIDTSTEGDINGVRADETARIAMVEEFIADDLTQRGFVLTAPPPDAVASILNPVRSNGADARIARDMGSDYAIAGEVQKVSNLIQSINLQLRDAETGETLRAGSVEIRGNTDDAFRRGYSYLLRNVIFREERKE